MNIWQRRTMTMTTSLIVSTNNLKGSEACTIASLGTTLNTMRIDTTKSLKAGVSYYDLPVSFDIEVSSFREGKQKLATMYLWTMCFCGVNVYGRTWAEFKTCIEGIKSYCNVDSNNRIVIYVHNLSYEFQFIKNHFKWSNIFSIDSRNVIYADSEDGVTFRCSYALSGLSLDNLSRTTGIKKLVGDLDFSKVRHSMSVITDEELQYAVNDSRIVCAYINDLLAKYKKITKIPLTNTGFVRALFKDKCLNISDVKSRASSAKYRKLMQELTIGGFDEYVMLKKAFMGGFVHSNPNNTNKTIEDVHSFDFSSSYPSVALFNKFPMGKAHDLRVESDEQLEEYLNKYCCMFDVEFMNVEALSSNEAYISSSKCITKSNVLEFNGRVGSASSIRLVVTEQDFLIIRKMYRWESMRIRNFKYYKKGFLPEQITKTIIELYKIKTELKGVKGREKEYQNAKARLNSIYGMMVTDFAKNYEAYGEAKSKPTKEQQEERIEKYNKDSHRFLFYPWGVWITAYARINLFTAILELKEDYVYSDTDSVKFTNLDAHIDYFANYNKYIERRISMTAKRMGVAESDFFPENIDGEKSVIGRWDYEGVSDKFKTLGAKRYMEQRADAFKITVSGLNKDKGATYMSTLGNDAFDAFNDGLTIDKDNSGCLTHTYIDGATEGILVDYRGVSHSWSELSSINIEASGFNVSMEDKYLDLLLNLMGLGS